MKTIVLAGGAGTRLSEETELIPKPMIEIGGKPILWHIMNIYAAYGFREFIVALGYKGEVIKNYFLNYYQLTSNLTVNLGEGKVNVCGKKREDWIVHLVDTGLATQTGGRVKRLADWIGGETFLLTYGDGVSDVNIQDLLTFHRRHKRIATVTAVRPPARFGGIIFDKALARQFKEKPQIGEGWINGGFFVLEPKIFDFIKEDETIFEREPLERLVGEQQLAVFQHDGFWQCMDTLRDKRLLEELWRSENPPWRVWNE